ncbi:MAG: DUF2164 domain-containing protein [Patescibacteria group bacterium]
MSDIKRKWDLLNKERRATLIKEIITYFKTERDEEIGVIAAEDILDFFLQNLGKDIYNKAIEDSKGVLKQSFENLEIDLDLLSNS